MAARQSRDLRLLRCEARFLVISPSRLCSCNNHSTRLSFRDAMISAIDSDTDSSFCLLSLSFTGAKWRLTSRSAFSFSLSRQLRCAKSSLSGASRTRTKISTNDREKYGVYSMSILSSRVRARNVWSTVREIIASQNEKFDADFYIERKLASNHYIVASHLKGGSPPPWFFDML